MEFKSADPIEMYIESTDSFAGDGSFLSKFNIEVRDQMSLSVAKKRFKEEFPNLLRPNEGDLVYFPLNKKMFRIQYSDEKAIFFQLGKLQTYKLTLELYEYSHERFSTGIAEIDDIYNRYTDPAIGTIDEDVFEAMDDSSEIQIEAEAILDFDENNPWGDV